MKKPHQRARRKRNLKRYRRWCRKEVRREREFEEALYPLVAAMQNFSMTLQANAINFHGAMSQLAKHVQPKWTAVQFKLTAAQQVQYYKVYVRSAGGPEGFSDRTRELTPPTEVPDVLGYVEGWRIWRVGGDGDHLLRPLVKAGYWHPGRNEARCENDEIYYTTVAMEEFAGEKHITPNPTCGCGFWGVWMLDDLPRRPGPDPDYGDEYDLVLGRIKGYGIVVEGDQGFRAQYAEVMWLSTYGHAKFLQPAPRWLRTVAQRQGVPLYRNLGKG